MFLGDNLIEGGISNLVEAFERDAPDAQLLLKRVPDPQRFGIAELDEDGGIVRLVEKPEDPPSDLALVGVYLFTSAILDAARRIEPTRRMELQQLNAITINAVPAPGVSLGEALDFFEALADERFPRELGYDHLGESRQYRQQGEALVVTFFLSLLVIYLVLAAQFESWRDPLIILMAVPMSIAGALFFVTLGFATINLYTQVGLITLIGLVAKNGILIVDFANRMRDQEGMALREAVEAAAAVRLRPILMTTVAMLVAMVPLLLASGPGAVSRFHIGLVVFTGLGIGTAFTLFVVPAFYVLLAQRERRTAREATASP
jgi:multidrug efflux pump